MEEMLAEVEIGKDSSEPEWDFDLLSQDVGTVESDMNECTEKLEDARKDLLMLKVEEQKKSQVQKQLLGKIEEVDGLNRENVVKFSLIQDVESEPQKIKTQVMTAKVN